MQRINSMNLRYFNCKCISREAVSHEPIQELTDQISRGQVEVKFDLLDH